MMSDVGVGVWLRDVGVWLYNFYFLALVFVIRQVWFVVSLLGFGYLLAVGLREEKRALEAQQIGIVAPRPYSVELLRRTRR
jgi:hypothetical protein